MIADLENKINQWGAWQRYFLLLFLLGVIYFIWYMLLEKPLLQRNKEIIVQQGQHQELQKELAIFSGMQSSFVYKNDLSHVDFKQIFQNSLSDTPAISITSYTADPVVPLPTGAAQFSSLAATLGVVLSNTLQRSSATLVFSGQFNDFVQYLKTLQNNVPAVYFDSIDFNMNRYPNAEITLKVFALGG